METKQKIVSTRDLALEWINSFPNEDKQMLATRYFSRSFKSLTGREIEQIYLKETAHIDTSDIESAYMMQIKPNQKQFKEFNSELARKYLNKFDNTAKKHFVLEACNMLSKSDLQYLKACITEMISEK